MRPSSPDIWTVHKESYPDTLKNMHRAPAFLYARGQWPASDEPARKYICVVGSRKQTPYGEDAVGHIMRGLRGYPISIVSGLAFGIDASAHIAALDAGLHCIGFPGSSLEWNRLYPREHLGLARRIVESGGLLLSEWAPEYPLGAWAFAARNRLMAGLAHATLIIEAGKKSGSLMTAKYAEDYGRDVFAVPGPIDAPQSYGPHMLIQNGAALVSSAEDILRELGYDTDRKGASSKSLSKEVEDDAISMSIVNALSLEPLTVDMLTERTRLPISTLSQKLSFLEIQGAIRMDGARVSRIMT